MITLPVVVTKSMFHEAPLLFIGIAPPPLDRNDPASRMSCMASNGVLEMSTFSFGSPGPLATIATPLATSSTCPSSSAVMLATRL